HQDETGGEALRDHHQAALGEFISHNAAKEGETHGRHAISEAHKAPGQGGTRELIDQPELAEAENLEATDRGQESQPEGTIRGVVQCRGEAERQSPHCSLHPGICHVTYLSPHPWYF